LHVDRTAITELPSFVSSLINLESLSFGGQGRIQPRWWTSITHPFGLSKQVPDSIGGLSCLRKLNLGGNSFTSLPGSLSQLSHLDELTLDGCKKLEVLPELPPKIWKFNASDCTSLREVLGSSKDELRLYSPAIWFPWPAAWAWKEAKNYVTFCFEDEDEDFEVKEMGVRLVSVEDIEQETDI
nr:NB-ARC domains-containing protein [Tanacetum cinerariifolium]